MFKSPLEKDEEVNLFNKTLEKLLNCLNIYPQDQDVLSFVWKMEDCHHNMQWFDGDAALKIVDVVRLC